MRNTLRGTTTAGSSLPSRWNPLTGRRRRGRTPLRSSRRLPFGCEDGSPTSLVPRDSFRSTRTAKTGRATVLFPVFRRTTWTSSVATGPSDDSFRGHSRSDQRNNSKDQDPPDDPNEVETYFDASEVWAHESHRSDSDDQPPLFDPPSSTFATLASYLPNVQSMSEKVTGWRDYGASWLNSIPTVSQVSQCAYSFAAWPAKKSLAAAWKFYDGAEEGESYSLQVVSPL